MNYYNEIKKEIKLDFKEEIDVIYFNIFYSLGLVDYFITEEKRYTRESPEETTKFIIEEAVGNVYHPPQFLNRFLFLEYENKKIVYHDYSVKNGEELGLIDGGEIFLKLDEDYIKTCSLNEKICLK